MWRIASLTAAIGALALAGLAANAARAHTSFCSIDPFGVYENNAATLFIGVATADSLPGGAPMERAAGFTPLGSELLAAPAWSQVVKVKRLSTSAPATLADAVGRNHDRVLLIPWEYGPDCSPGTWSGSALWMEPGTRGFFSGILRPREKWVGDVPTFDVGAPFNIPYPCGMSFVLRLRGAIPLTADELMSLYDSLPRRNFERTDRVTYLKREERRHRAIIEWGERHPYLADRPPLAEMLRSARRESTLSQFLMRTSPLAGTWRFALEVPGHEPLTIYGRTERHASSLDVSRGEDMEKWLLEGRPPYGYSLQMIVSGTAADLDASPGRGSMDRGYLSAAFEPELVTPDSTVWGANAGFLGAGLKPGELPKLRKEFALLRAAAFAYLSSGRPRYAPGRIVTKPDGSAKLELVYRDSHVVVASVRGERLSTVSWNPR